MTEVIVYTQTPCKYCEILKIWLTSEGIGFETRNISEEKKYKEEAEALGAMGMPFTVVNKKTFAGMNADVQKGIREALAR